MDYQGPSKALTLSRFARIAPAYDRTNTILSLGIHKLWRRSLIKDAELKPKMKILDCATGTGDLALQMAKLGCEVTGLDISAEMLGEAEKKATAANSNAKFCLGDATKLPFADRQFDRLTISFGIRNVEQPRAALREFSRVVKPGGRVLILEFGKVQTPVWREVFNFFARHCLPRIGKLMTGERAPYEYLTTSSAAFPCGQDFLTLFKTEEGYEEASFKRLWGGVAYLYVAKIRRSLPIP